MINSCMDNSNVVRFMVSRELSEEEVALIIEIVDQHAYVAEETTFEEDTCDIDSHVHVDVGESEGEYIYDIPVIEPISPLDARFMAEKIADVIDDDFELGADYDK